MKICLAQTNPVKGDIEQNITDHMKLIDLALEAEADIIVFPELSLTGYEPELANDLAISINDHRLDRFDKISDQHNMLIGVGAPVHGDNAVHIGMIFSRPGQERAVYYKEYLHVDEEPFFEGKVNDPGVLVIKENLAPAICYELSIPEHSRRAQEMGAEIYLASAAKTEEGVQQATADMVEIARRYSMLTMMVNCTGNCDGVVCSGNSSIWLPDGTLKYQMDAGSQGVVVYDTRTCEVEEILV